MVLGIAQAASRSADRLKELGSRTFRAASTSPVVKSSEGTLTGLALRGLFAAMDLRLRFDPDYRSLIYRDGGAELGDDWQAQVVFEARDGTFAFCATFDGGRVTCSGAVPPKPEARLIFRDAASARAMLTETPDRVLEMLLTGELQFVGNLSHVARMSFMLSALVDRTKGAEVGPRREIRRPPPRRSLPMDRCDEVRHLDDPALSHLTLDDFPRLSRFLDDYFCVTPAICTERPRLYTESLRAQGFDPAVPTNGVHPALRQAKAFSHVMSKRKPIIRPGDLLAGTTTSKPLGVIVYPECGGIPIWPELRTMSRRKLNPYRITEEEVRLLNDQIFPFWMDKNVREHVRACHDNPRSLQLDERFALYFQWKTQAVSHTIPGFPTVLDQGLVALRQQALDRADADGADGRKASFHEAMALSLEGVMRYAAKLADQAAADARAESDPERRQELEELARICTKVPAQPAETLHEALQSMWCVWVACHLENTNCGLSIGRLDQWLQPYLETDVERLPEGDEEAKRSYVKRAIELTGCFYLRCTDHLPQVADLGNKLFGGSASGQVITLGGVTEGGDNGVVDMTFICLKVTEMLGLRDPNINARYHEKINSTAYLRRLCEVNLLTGATPSIHNDQAVIDVLHDQGFDEQEARDWSATGCVEPTSCGRHYGHTNCMMFNLVAPLEMALRRGFHPLVGEQVGPPTADPARFESFDQVLDAYFAQLRRLIELATEANNLLGEGHQVVRPTPLLSNLIAGPLECGRDLSEGGARHNSSGSGNVGLVDVVDSLLAIRQLVFEERRIDMETLVAALDADFEGHEALLSRIEHRVPKFGSGDAAPREMAERVIAFCHETFRAQPHYRGGHYNSGFWSMSNHVAFGTLSGALPSGRRKGKAFTPGITPTATRRASIVEHIHDVASLDHHLMPNNIAFNVKVAPGPKDSQQDAVGHMTGYALTYFQQGGMQMQFNVVSTETLRDARRNPDLYPTLLVRISGYNAYFNDLNDDMKRELIERAEHRLGA
ncbi:MAG: formate acetyltransferase [Deltaproteobacteria bacterium]|nr:formate acetyltransferase [Deltaproteobacteria bacterium]